MTTRPNILWFSLEDTSPRFGCYGDTIAKTPNLDRVAQEGCVYPNAFSVAGVCAPSRSAIITGMYQTFIGSHHMRTTHTHPATPELPTPYECVPPHYVKCFTEYLRAAGYYCTNNEKTDYQFSPPLTAWDQLGKKAHWRNRKAGQPFFSVFNPIVTHESGQWPPGNSPRVTDPAEVTLPPYLPDTLAMRQALARQYDNIHVADQQLGQILRELEEDGLLDNTIIVVWSDHGEGLPRAKRWCYDSGTRIPCIVRWQGQITPGSSNRRLVSLIDLAPTMLSLAGVPIPAHLQGAPFVGPAEQPREYVYAARDRFDEAYDMIRAVRGERYRYVRNYMPELPYQIWIPYNYRHPGQQDLWRMRLDGTLGDNRMMLDRRPPEELYDLQTDPFELTNLADRPEHATTLRDMRQVMDDWRLRYDRWGDVPEREMVAKWWPGGSQPDTAAPLMIPIGPETPGIDPAPQGGSYPGPLLLQMHCATQGASMAWTTDPGHAPAWNLYTGPIRVEKGQQLAIRCRACRIGYKPSDEVSATFVAR